MEFKEEKKREILDAFFSLPGDLNSKARVLLSVKIDEYLKTYKNDAQIKDVKRLAKAYFHSFKFGDLNKCITIAKPIFNRLIKDRIIFDYYDIKIGIACIGMSWDYKKIIKLSDKLTNELESFKDHKSFNHMKMTMYMNVIDILYIIKLQKNVITENIKELDTAFINITDKIEELNKSYRHPYIVPHLLVKKGIFLGNNVLVEEGLNLAKEFANKNIFKTLKSMIKDADGFTTFKIPDSEYNRIIGLKLQKLRKYYGLTVKQLANILEISHGLISGIERGQKSLKDSHKKKLLKIFNCSEDALSLNQNVVESAPRSESEKLLDFINVSSSTLDKEDLKIVAYFVHIFKRKAVSDFINKLLIRMEDNPENPNF